MMRALVGTSLLCATALLVGCSSASDAPVATAQTTTTASPAVEDTTPKAGPVEAYRAWLTASRKPNAPQACSLMSEALQKRMLAELAASAGTTFPDCESMITSTAAMYAAAGSSAEVDVKVVSETAAEATLFSTYVDSGKCGTIHLRSTGTGWIMTEQSKGCVK